MNLRRFDAQTKLQQDLLHNSLQPFVHLTNERLQTQPGPTHETWKVLCFQISPNLLFLHRFLTFVPAFGSFGAVQLHWDITRLDARPLQFDILIAPWILRKKRRHDSKEFASINSSSLSDGRRPGMPSQHREQGARLQR